jgi:trk system potassium uptake protein TrkH
VATTSASDDPKLPLLHAAALGPQLSLWLAGAYFVLLLIGVAVFRLPGATIRGNEISFERAVFTVINAATLTGFQQAVPLDDFGPTGKACVLGLTIAGTLFTLLVGGLALVRATRMPYTDAQVIRATLFTYVFLVGCGSALLVEPQRGLLPSAMQAACAFGNSGIVLGKLPGAVDWRTHAALMPLALLGGLSIPVLMELTDVIFARRKLTTHSAVVLTLSAAVYLVGFLALIPWQQPSADGVVSASALSIDSRSAGLPLATIGEMSRTAQWLLIVLMLIGPAPAGSGGGMKVTALFHFARGVRRALQRQGGLRVTGIAAVWIASYLGLVLATLLGLLATLPEMAADRLVFLAASAVGTVGLSHDPISVTGPGVMILCAAMLAGRVAPLLVLWWCAQTCDDADVAV